MGRIGRDNIGVPAMTVLGFVALGFGMILSPFFIVAYLFPDTKYFFWAWLKYVGFRQ
jgi:type IV secretory pathway VirB6-like protein